MRTNYALILAAGGSALMLAAAFAFQHIGGMAPCKMCIWQRYPHGIAIAIGLLAVALSQRWLLPIGALAAFTTSGIGFYHAGVERGWWEGPTTCSSGPVGGLSPDALFEQIMTAPLVRCDEIPWELFGLSMAGWNAVISLGLGLLWLRAWQQA
jgi:disulfide bond formation protein DsbB